jgi:hypothetical protein
VAEISGKLARDISNVHLGASCMCDKSCHVFSVGVIPKYCETHSPDWIHSHSGYSSSTSTSIEKIDIILALGEILLTVKLTKGQQIIERSCNR